MNVVMSVVEWSAESYKVKDCFYSPRLSYSVVKEHDEFPGLIDLSMHSSVIRGLYYLESVEDIHNYVAAHVVDYFEDINEWTSEFLENYLNYSFNVIVPVCDVGDDEDYRLVELELTVIGVETTIHEVMKCELNGEDDPLSDYLYTNGRMVFHLVGDLNRMMEKSGKRSLLMLSFDVNEFDNANRKELIRGYYEKRYDGLSLDISEEDISYFIEYVNWFCSQYDDTYYTKDQVRGFFDLVIAEIRRLNSVILFNYIYD